MAVSSALARALAAERQGLNARVAAARVRVPDFDAGQLAGFVQQHVDPLVTAIAVKAPEAVPRCVTAMFGMAIDLVSHGLAGGGARAALVASVWSDVAPGIVPLIAADPVESLGALTNAAVQLGGSEGVRDAEWLTLMAALTPAARDSRDLRVLAAIAAWRAGAAHFREGALAAAATLPPALACAACGGDGEDWPGLVGAFARNRWWRPSGDRAVSGGRRTGQFTGFGGRFARPPQVRACAQGFLVRSAERTFLLIADAHGATLHAAAPEEFAAAPALLWAGPVGLEGATVVAPDRRIALDWPVDGLALAANDDAIAVTSPYSHAIRVLPRVLP